MASKQPKGRKAGSRVLTQKFDPRSQLIGGVPGLGGRKLDRGRLVHADTGKVIKFQHNPIAVSVSHASVSHAMHADMQNADVLAEMQMGRGVLAGGLGGVRVDLKYDRTYETWDKSYANTAVGKYGVYADVLAFYDFVGITPAHVGFSSTSPIWPKIDVWQSMFPETAMAPTMAYLHFGNKLKYYGQIMDLGVTYTHFTHKMVPNRCVIGLTLALLPAIILDDRPGAPKKDKSVPSRQWDAKNGMD